MTIYDIKKAEYDDTNSMKTKITKFRIQRRTMTARATMTVNATPPPPTTHSQREAPPPSCRNCMPPSPLPAARIPLRQRLAIETWQQQH